VTTQEQQRIAELEREVRELRRANESSRRRALMWVIAVKSRSDQGTEAARCGGNCNAKASSWRCTVERLMRQLGLRGAVRGKTDAPPSPTHRPHAPPTW
jgi:hypothetical protein